MKNVVCNESQKKRNTSDGKLNGCSKQMQIGKELYIYNNIYSTHPPGWVGGVSRLARVLRRAVYSSLHTLPCHVHDRHSIDTPILKDFVWM